MCNDNLRFAVRKNKLVQPILKWVGGKRQLLSEIDKLLPRNYKTYYEPFVGGGAVLFHVQPKKAVINDINSELINVYEVVKNNLDELLVALKDHKNESNYFYKIRELDRNSQSYDALSDIDKASRIIFLNKTCYNGLFRVNSKGEFNSPFGSYKKPNIVNEVILKAVSKYLNSTDIEFTSVDFYNSLDRVNKGDFVYFDPPYDPISSSSNFTGYDKSGFNRDEQLRLKSICDELDNKGVKFLLSNSATDFIREIYRDYDIKVVHARRSINAKGNARGDVKEVLIRNYE